MFTTSFDSRNAYRTCNSNLQMKTEAVQCEDRWRLFGRPLYIVRVEDQVERGKL